MKRIVLILAIVAIAAVAVVAANLSTTPKPQTDMISKLWKEYESWEKADRPQKMIETLDKIKTEALSARSAIDYYRAAILCAETRRRVNWKETTAAFSQLEKEIKAYDLPIMTYAWITNYNSGDKNSYPEKNKDALAAGRHPEFWEKFGDRMGGHLADYIKDDYEYTLWHRIIGTWGLEFYSLRDSLKDRIGDRYPLNGYLDYYLVTRYPAKDQVEAMAVLDRKWEGKAIGLLPKQAVLKNKFNSAENHHAKSEEFKALYEECKAFETYRKSFKDDEKMIAATITTAKELMEQMESKDVDVTVKGEVVTVTMRNLTKVPVTLYESREESLNKKIWTRTVENKKCSFYAVDTVRFTIPPLKDGDYCLKAAPSGAESAICYYRHNTLSLALRTDSKGPEIYVAEYLSGRPVKKVKAELILKGNTVESKEMELDGFTRLPESMVSTIRKHDDRSYFIRVSAKGEDGLEKCSSESLVNADSYFYDSSRSYASSRCNIFKDKGAYNTGETVNFKAVWFKGDLLKENHVLPGEVLTAVFYDSEGNELGRRELTTNEFGSIAGSFDIPKGLRGGQFRIVIEKEGRTLESDYFPVGEFVLPTFFVTFEPIEGLFFPGDKVTVKGKVESYSGHPLTELIPKVMIESWHLNAEIEAPEIKPDGSFAFDYITQTYGFHKLILRVTDNTGETQENATYFFVLDSFRTELIPDSPAEGSFSLRGEKAIERGWESYSYNSLSSGILDSEKELFKIQVTNSDGAEVNGIPVEWKLLSDKAETIAQGKALSGDKIEIDLSGAAGNYFAIQTHAEIKGSDGHMRQSSHQYRFVKVLPGDTSLSAPVSQLWMPTAMNVKPGEKFGARFGGADGIIWAVATLFGPGGKQIESFLLESPDKLISDISFTYKDEYPEAVRLQVFLFKYGDSFSYSKEFRRDRDVMALPLSFERFTEKGAPASRYTVTLKTEAGVEALAAVFDKSVDAIARNNWPVVTMRSFTAGSVYANANCGFIGERQVFRYYETRAAGRALAKGAMERMPEPLLMADMAVEEAVMTGSNSASEKEVAAVTVREQFRTALAFEPFLRSSDDGLISFDFTTSDRLSTYYVYVYAHDKSMRNAFVQNEMQISMPVKVSITEPTILREGDVYKVALAVSSAAGKNLSGKLYLFAYNGSDGSGEAFTAQSVPLKVKNGQSTSSQFTVKVPRGIDNLTLKGVFKADDFSDAVQVTVPVGKGEQQITEAHSGVFVAGMSKTALEAELRSRFVGIPGRSAEYSEITIIDMVKDAIKAKEIPERTDVLTLSEAWYVAKMNEKLGKDPIENDYLEKILACRNSDGGFGWFEGLDSSPVISAVILERFAKIARHGFEVPSLESTVKYLDKQQFKEEIVIWRGHLTDAQYLFVRSLYPSVPFEVKPFGDTGIFSKRMTEFKKYTKEYLTPEERRGLDGMLFSKARRLATLDNLAANDEGVALAKAWGIGGSALKKVRESADDDVASLLEYAVKHRDGGYYYPNLVMPFRGLLESEAYAHSMIADLLWSHGDIKSSTISTAGVADGVRLWLMLQKETQKWDADPAFLDAINTILSGSEDLLKTTVLMLKATFTSPISKIKASGNGFTIHRSFTRNGKLLTPGEKLSVGDKITARYEIWNQENRSFVRLIAPHEGALRPVEQRSGYYGGIGFYGGYRDVRSDRTEYFFTACPEENSTVSEDFFVTSAGEFIAPVVTIESLYADHYRANDAFPGKVIVK